MRKMGFWSGVVAVTWFAGSVAVAAPVATDLHDYWDDRCKSCHSDAAAFARSTLAVDDAGQLVGRHHRDRLDVFLRQHYLTDELVVPVTAMLLAQVNSTPVFRQKCSACHESAAALARKSLVTRGGVLTGKASGQPMADFLRRHGGLDNAEIGPMVKTLERVLKEVGGGTQAAQAGSR